MFVCILHLVTLVLAFFIFRQNQIFFLIAEALVLVSLVVSWQLYKQLIQPLKNLSQGIEAIRDKDFSTKFNLTGKREMDALIDIFNQMMDELRHERTIQQQQHFFLEKVIETSPTGILITDYDEKVYALNARALAILKIEPQTILQKPLDAIADPLLIAAKQLPAGSSILYSANGIDTFKLQKSRFIDRGFPRIFVSIEELTAEILAAEKKAYGKVIRMMAHEVNNTLGPVNSILSSTVAEDSLWQFAVNTPIKAALEVAIERNNNLNRFMRNFADVVRLPDPSKEVFDLHELISNVSGLMKRKAANQGISFELQFCTGTFMVMADLLQLEQVLINVVKNAIEAIDGEGLVTFITKRSPHVLIVRDNGSGIATERAKEIFSPFFSTKKDGQGIGLTIVREILLNHHFGFSLETVEKGRTDFVIRF